MEYLAASMGLELKIKKPKRVKTERSYLSVAEARAMLDVCSTQRDKAIIALLLYTGLRSNELCSTEIEDLDSKNHILMVRDHGQGIKNYTERNVIIAPDGMKILEGWTSVRPIDKDPNLFLNIYGKRLSQKQLQNIVNNVARRAGIEKHVYPHLLRHTCASNMIKSGVPITEVMLQLGHKSLQSTMIYLHGDIKTLKENIDKKFRY